MTVNDSCCYVQMSCHVLHMQVIYASDNIMETSASFNINQICRVCLSPAESPKVASLFFATGQAVQLWAKVMACAWVQVFEGDGMPSLICHKCQSRLDVAYSFKQQCEASDAHLRQYLGLPVPQIETQSTTKRQDYSQDQPVVCDSNIYTVEVEAAPKQELTPEFSPLKREPVAYTSQAATPYTESECEYDPSFKCEIEIDAEAALLKNNKTANNTQIVISQSQIIPYPLVKLNTASCGTQYKEVDYSSLQNELLQSFPESESESILNSDTPLDEICEKINMLKEPKDISQLKLNGNKRKQKKKVKVKKIRRRRKIGHDKNHILNEVLEEVKHEMEEREDLNGVEDGDIEDEEYETEGRSGKKMVQEQCELCGKIFHYRGYMAQHMRTHTGDKPFECDVCHQRFSMYHSLIIHLRIHSGDRPFICAVCGKGFTQSAGLTSHMRSHTGEKPFQCEICSKQFSQSSNLLIHRQIHSGQRDHVCPTCNKAFKFLKHLQSHLKLHTGVKDYKCSICHKGFYRKSYLNTHMAIHSGHRPYKCSDCGHAFSNSSNLTAHMRIHTGIKPYVCQVCKKAFAQSSALTRHVQQHSEVSKSEARGIPQYPSTGEPRVHKGTVDLDNWRMTVAKTNVGSKSNSVKDTKDLMTYENVIVTELKL